MADVKINLEATHKDFVASLAAATQAATVLVRELQGLKDSHEKAGLSAGKHSDEEKKVTDNLNTSARAARGGSSAHAALGASIGKNILLYGALIVVALKAAEGIAQAFIKPLQTIDDFQRQAIGTAIAITNLNDPVQNAGRTIDSVFNQNLKATVATFIELETISRRYFASAADLQLAYNQFAQRGIVLGRANLEQLAQLTTQILLLTGGQNSAIQVQEEIRDLITGTLRPTAQLAQQIRSFGKDVKDVGAQIRALQNLDPLKEFLVGTAAASKAIQGTLTPAINGFLTTLRQITRVGFGDLFTTVVDSIRSLTDFLTAHKATIAGIFGVISKVVGDAVTELSAFTREFFKANKAASDGSTFLIDVVAALETLALALIRVTELIVLLARDLPAIIQTLREGFSEQATQDAASGIDKIRLSFIELVRGTPIGFLVEQINKIKGVSEKTREALTNLIPGGPKILQGLDLLQKVADIIQKDFGAIKAVDFSETFQRFRDGLIKARAESERAAKALGASGGPGSAATFIPFKPSPDQISALKQLNDDLRSAEDRLARARRTAEVLIVRANIAIDLQGFQKDLALLDQGFILSNRAVIGLRSALNDINTFIGSNLDATVFGASANFTQLRDTISNSIAGISTDILAKTRESAKRAADGIELFKKTTQDASEELRKTEVVPHLIKADQIRDDANHEFQVIADAAAKAVNDAQVILDKALKSGTKKQIDDALEVLKTATQNQFSGLDFAKRQQQFRLQFETVERQIAATNQLKIKEQEVGLVTAENRRIRQEQLAVIQATNVEVGKSFQQLKTAQNAANQFLEQTSKTRPRTDLEISGGAIQEQREKFTFDIGEAQGRLRGLESQFNVFSDEIAKGNFALIDAQAQLGKTIKVREEEIGVLKELQDRSLAVAEHLRAFALSFRVLDDAVRRTADTLIDALLNSFEGKKTDFVSSFKSITDQIFKDSLTNVVQSLQKKVRESFENIFSKLNISDDMAKTLGPAFLAGFALIASFVLGSLLSGSHNTASAANPQIGIQSSEQVRGLIGGQTQIPIGLVGESLQNALVPTNFLLTRIASGIDRIGGGGSISATSIESVVSRAVSDAVQAQ